MAAVASLWAGKVSFFHYCRLDRRKKISQRVVNAWNSIPSEVVEAESVNAFKIGMIDTCRWFKVKVSLE